MHVDDYLKIGVVFMLFYKVVASSMGKLLLVSSGDKLLRIDFLKDNEQEVLREISRKHEIIEGNTSTINKTILQLDEYFAGTRKNFSVPLELNGTKFQKMVWQALIEIPYGQTVSYKLVAEKIGNIKACRAVGMANNKNPIPIIIPCHRVIGHNGKLVGYGGGLGIKKYLLNLERGDFNAMSSSSYSL